MGQTQNTPQRYLEQWNKIETFDSRILNAEVDIYEKNGEKVQVIQRVCQSEQQYTRELRRFQNQKQNHVNGLLQLIHLDHLEESTLCSNMYRITAIYEFASPLPKISFQDFLWQITHILIDLQAKDVFHEDLRPQSFFYTNQIKTVLPTASQYNKFLGGLENECYLAPELFIQLGRRNYKPTYSKEKSDVYTLGLVCLEMHLGISIQQIYNFQEYIIDQIQLDVFIAKAQSQLISWMLQSQPESRPTFTQLYEASLIPEIKEELQYLTISQQHNNRYSSNNQNRPQLINEPVFDGAFSRMSEQMNTSRRYTQPQHSSPIQQQDIENQQQSEPLVKLQTATKLDIPRIQSPPVVSKKTTQQSKRPSSVLRDIGNNTRSTTNRSDMKPLLQNTGVLKQQNKKPTLIKSNRNPANKAAIVVLKKKQ